MEEEIEPCNCVCHDVSGIHHFMPCCSFTYEDRTKYGQPKKSLEELSKEWILREK